MRLIFTNTFTRLLRLALLGLFLFGLAGCATNRLIEHGIDADVKGSQAIHDIQVLYGEKVINFEGIRPPGSSGGWNAPMPIPDSMTVKWTVNGIVKVVVVPLKGKLSHADRIANWRLYFYGDQLEVWRVDDDPASRYYFKPEVKVFP